jgi:beta-lactam-binding protein with PASTA domain
MSRPPDEPVDLDGETVIDPEWRPGPDHQVLVEEEREVAPPPRPPRPTLWPWLLALLVLVLGGLGAAIYLADDDDDESPSATAATSGTDRTTSATTTGATTTGTTTTGTTTAATTAVATVAVPDVGGAPASDAQATLRDAGLRANLHTVPSTRPAGTVVAQNPAAGAEVDEGSAVRLNVSAGGTPPAPPEPASVPDVVGLEQTEAVRALQQAGLEASVQLVPSEEPQSRVVAQAREPGASLERGDAVQINVSTGPDPAPNSAIPDVVGRGEQEARDQLRAAGFHVQVVKVDAPAPAQRGRVIDQQPGGEAPEGWEITLLVGRLAG